MSHLRGRLDKLEKTLEPAKTQPRLMRVLVTSPVKRAERSTCERTLRNGVLTEIVMVEGDCADLSADELEIFIQSSPIKEQI